MGVGRTSGEPSSLSLQSGDMLELVAQGWWGQGSSPSAGTQPAAPSQGLEDSKTGMWGQGALAGVSRGVEGALAVVGCSGSAVCHLDKTCTLRLFPTGLQEGRKHACVSK